MSLLDDAINLQQRPGSPCSVQILGETDPDLAAELWEAIRSSVQAAAIARALEKRGVRITPEAITRHRRNECQRCR